MPRPEQGASTNTQSKQGANGRGQSGVAAHDGDAGASLADQRVTKQGNPSRAQVAGNEHRLLWHRTRDGDGLPPRRRAQVQDALMGLGLDEVGDQL